MCDFSGKLIAWMDGELSEGKAVSLPRHMSEACADLPKPIGGISASERLDSPPTAMRRSPWPGLKKPKISQ